MVDSHRLPGDRELCIAISRTRSGEVIYASICTCERTSTNLRTTELITLIGSVNEGIEGECRLKLDLQLGTLTGVQQNAKENLICIRQP